MSYLRNRVKQTTSGSGTGALTLGAAAVGYLTAESQFDEAERFHVLIEQGDAWELSMVHFTGTTLTRQLCHASSNADAFVDFAAGDKTLSVVQLAPRRLATPPGVFTHDQATGYLAGDFVWAPVATGSTAYCYWLCTSSTDSAGLWAQLPRGTSNGGQVSQGTTLGGGDGNLAGSATSVVLGGEYNYVSGSAVAAGRGALNGGNGGYFAAGGGYLDEGAGNNVARGTGSLQALTAKTTDATPTLLAFNFAADYGEYVDIGVVRISAKVVAFEKATGDCKEWSVEAMARMTASYASLDLIGTPTVSSAFATAGAATWDVSVGVSALDETLELTVTGEAAHTIYWTAAMVKVDLSVADSAA